MGDIKKPSYETDIIGEDQKFSADLLFSNITKNPGLSQMSLDILADNPNIDTADEGERTDIIQKIGEQGLAQVLSFHTIISNGLDTRVLEFDLDTQNEASADPRHLNARNQFKGNSSKSELFRHNHRVKIAAIELSHFARRTDLFQQAQSMDLPQQTAKNESDMPASA